MKLLRIIMAVVAVAGVLASVEAKASPLEVMFWDWMTGPLVVTDGGVGDTDPADGSISLSQVYNGWTLNVSGAHSNPAAGPGVASLDFGSVQIASNASDPQLLTMFLSAGGFTHSGNISLEISGATSGMINSAAAYWTNVLPDWGGDVTLNPLFDELGPLAGVFFQTGAGPVPVPDGQQYALTLGAIIFHDVGLAETSFEQSASAVPLPGAATLIGPGLLGLIALRRKISAIL